MLATAEKAIQYVASLPENGTLKTFAIIGKMPTTQFRIAVTILVTVATAARYMSSTTWIPSWQWLSFLLGMAGVDTASHIAQRMTDIDYAKAKNGGTSGDDPGDTDMTNRPGSPEIG